MKMTRMINFNAVQAAHVVKKVWPQIAIIFASLAALSLNHDATLAFLPLLVGAAAGIGSGVAGNLLSAGDRRRAVEANQKAVQEWLDINVPDPEQQRLALERYVQTGELTPELEQAVKREETNFQNVSTDPRLRESRLRALRELEDLGASGGLSFEDKANLADAEAQIASEARARREGITNRLASQGLAGSGFELQAQLAGAQTDQNQLSNARLRTLSDARRRALEAIMGAGDLAGGIEDDDYREQSDLARAKDEVDAFNAQLLQGVNTRNTNRRNDAQAANLDMRQRIADKNVDLGNQERQWNQVGRYQQAFDNRTKLATGRSNAYTGQANQFNQDANRTANMFSNIGQGAAKLGAAAYYDQKTPKTTPSLMIDDSVVGMEDDEPRRKNYFGRLA